MRSIRNSIALDGAATFPSSGNPLRLRLTDPLVPIGALMMGATAAALSGSASLAWVTLGAVAGYALSGST